MIDKILVKNKLADIEGYFKELNPLLAENASDILADNLKIRTVERLFQLIVDTSIDINTHLISESGLQVPDDYQSTFVTLSQNKILPMDLALRIAPSVGLRNLVVHKYGRVDVKKMIEDIKTEIGDYLEYMKAVDRFITA